MKAVARWLASNVPLMFLAVALSALTWVMATEQSDPSRTQTFSQPIPVEITGLSEEMAIVSRSAESVRATVRAPASVWNTLSADNFRAVVDAGGLEPGAHELPIQVTLNRNPARLLEAQPQTLRLVFDNYLERAIPVDIQVEGDPALGYLARTPILDPREVTVSGPESWVTRVVEAYTAVSIDGADEDVDGVFPVQLKDEAGELVTDLEPVPQVVDVRIPIEESGYYRSLAVKVILEGQVAQDYRITEIAVDPPAVTVFGVPDVVAALPGFIETQPINVEGAEEDVVVRPSLVLPENVSVVGQQLAEVRVLVEAIESSKTVSVVPEIQGMGPDLTGTVSPSSVEIIVSGPVPLLNSMEEDDVRVVIDLYGLGRGTHRVDPEVILPEGLTARSILPETLQVDIADSLSATPTQEPEALE